MGTRKHWAVVSMIAAAGCALGLGTSLAHGNPEDLSPIPASTGEGLGLVRGWLAAGQCVQAKSSVLELLETRSGTMSDAESEEAFKLLQQASAAVRKLSPAESSLQKAELALVQGDLLNARSQVEAVLSIPTLDGPMLVRAERLNESIDARRDELAPLAHTRLARALDAFGAGRLAEAKADLTFVMRADVPLSPEQRQALTSCQSQIVERELAGAALDAPVTLSAVQPGVIRRNTDPEPAQLPEAPAQPAADQPAGQQPAADAPAQPPVDTVIADATRKEGERLFAQAMAAKSSQNYAEARTLLERVDRDYRASLTPEMQDQVTRELTEVQLRLREQVGAGSNLLQPIEQSREIARQEARATFDNLMAQSEAALQAGNFSRARELALQAQLKMNERRDVFAEAEFQERVGAADARVREVESAEEAAQNADAERRAREEEARIRQGREDEEMKKRRQINEAIARVRDLQRSQKYREALDIVENQILFLESNNPAGLLLRDVIYDVIIFKEYHEARREKFAYFAGLRLENYEASIPPMGIINFPQDWPSITFQRAGSAVTSESPQDRALLAKLRDQRLNSVELPGVRLEQALAYVGSSGQLNMQVEWDALEEAGITRDSTIQLSLKNVSLQGLIERILDAASGDDLSGEAAGYMVADGTLVISSDKKIRKHTVLEIYDIRDLVVEVPDYSNAPDFDLNQILQSSRGGGGQSPFQNNDDDETDREPLQDRIDRMKDMIRELIDPGEWVEDGGETGRMYDWNGQLVVVNTPANHREIRGLLSQLRQVRAMQINVETRFLLVSQDFFEQIGFDLDVYFNGDSSQVAAARGTDPSILPSDFFDTTGRLKRNITGAGTAPITQAVTPPNQGSVIGTTQNSFGLTTSLLPQSGLAADIVGRAPALGVAGQFLDDIQVDFLIQATQADRRTVSLTAPRLTFTNGQTSNIYVVRQIGFVSDLQPVVSDSAVGFDPTIDVVSSGVRMLVDGIVSADRRFVTMNIDAAIAEIEGFQNQPVTAVAGGQLVSSQSAQSFIQIPTVTVTRVQTTVTVPDQGTILLGGQRLVSEVEVETGVPVLSKIPILNRFFSNRIQSKEESTLLILVKPTVLITGEREDQEFPGLAEQMNAGFGG